MRPRVIFDTSAINKLLKDPDREALIVGCRSAYFVRITEANCAEIAGNHDPDLRIQLVDLLRRLIEDGECITAFHDIVERCIRAFERGSAEFDWRRVQVRFKSAELELVYKKAFTDELAAVQREQLKSLSEQFEGMFQEMRKGFDSLFGGSNKKRPALTELLQAFMGPQGSMWAYGEILYSKIAPATEEKVRLIHEACPPFRALVLALCLALHERCLRGPQHGRSRRAGRVDTFMATYLPYADIFVTDDKKQLECLKAIVTEGKFETSVRSYKEFRQ